MKGIYLPEVVVTVGMVSDQPQEVKPRQQCSGQLDILLDGSLGVVAAVGGIGSGQNTHPCVQRCDNTSLIKDMKVRSNCPT